MEKEKLDLILEYLNPIFLFLKDFDNFFIKFDYATESYVFLNFFTAGEFAIFVLIFLFYLTYLLKWLWLLLR